MLFRSSARGGYELVAATGKTRVSLLASGSEVEIAVAARKLLEADGVGTRIVSVPCMDLFQAQPETYRDEVLGPGSVRVAIEAGIRMGWDALIGLKGGFVGMSDFGASGPYKALYQHFGITPEAVAAAAKARL